MNLFVGCKVTNVSCGLWWGKYVSTCVFVKTHVVFLPTYFHLNDNRMDINIHCIATARTFCWTVQGCFYSLLGISEHFTATAVQNLFSRIFEVFLFLSLVLGLGLVVSSISFGHNFPIYDIIFVSYMSSCGLPYGNSYINSNVKLKELSQQRKKYILHP